MSAYKFRKYYNVDLTALCELDLISILSKKDWLANTYNALSRKDVEFFNKAERILKDLRKKPFCGTCAQRLGWNTCCQTCLYFN
jgi:NADH pyrophosphatase NudC (nudix superfamily)